MIRIGETISFNGEESTLNQLKNLRKKLLMELKKRKTTGDDSGRDKTFSMTHISNNIQNEGNIFKQSRGK